jgi:hypothetical protein
VEIGLNIRHKHAQLHELPRIQEFRVFLIFNSFVAADSRFFKKVCDRLQIRFFMVKACFQCIRYEIVKDDLLCFLQRLLGFNEFICKSQNRSLFYKNAKSVYRTMSSFNLMFVDSVKLLGVS